jgi:hypothetical protein
MVDATYDEIEAQAVRLSALEKARLIGKLSAALGDELAPKRPKRSLHGLWADLNLDISEEDIQEMRREMWD